jgi:putative PIN family toxin of toxin-antitoxin system
MTSSYVVIDTNVWIRQFLSPGGVADSAIAKALERHMPVFDLDTFEELRTRLERPKVAKLSTPEQRQAFLEGTAGNSVFVERTHQVVRVLADPDDNKFLGLAMTVGASSVISGDEHLQAIKHYQGIQIWSPEGFLQLERERDRLVGGSVTPKATVRRPGRRLDDP